MNPHDPASLERSVRLLLEKKLLELWPRGLKKLGAGLEVSRSLVFFHQIPSELLSERFHALERGARVGDWFLFTDVDDPSWLGPMAGDFGVNVGVVESEAKVEAIRERLSPRAASLGPDPDEFPDGNVLGGTHPEDL